MKIRNIISNGKSQIPEQKDEKKMKWKAKVKMKKKKYNKS